MSAGSGIAEKGDAASAPSSITTKSKEPTAASTSKPSYATLNINDLYRGKSLEQSKTPAPRHGMQTLGKVVRRNQSTASATGLTSADTSTSDPVSSSSSSSADHKQSGSDASTSNAISGSLTGSSLSSSNSGWATVSSADPATASAGQQPDSCLSKPGTGTRQPSAASTGSSQSTPWTAGQAAGSAPSQVPERMFSDQIRGKTSLLPAQEFPELGEDVPASRQTEARPQPAADPGPYGPGPSLRPAIGANWSQGSANAAAAQPTSGGVVNGSQPGDRNQQLNPAPGSQAFTGATNTGNGGAGNMYRGQAASGQRSAFPGAGGSALTSASGSDFRGNRSKSGKEEPAIVKFNASIMPDEKISEFDEILEKGDIRSDWTAICDAIDYDQDLNFDLDDCALDSAFKTKQTPISESNCLSSAASSAAIDVKTAAAGSRKVHAFEDEFTRSPPNSGRVLYDPRDQKQLRDNRSAAAGPRSRRTSEKSDDVHSEGRGSAPKSQSYGRDGNRGPVHDPRDPIRTGYSSNNNNKQQMQQAQLPPRFQKQLLQQQQQQLQQNHHHQQQHPYLQPGDRRYDSRRDAPGIGPHHPSEWRPQPQQPAPRNEPRAGPAATSAADEMNWRSASKKVTESASSRSSDARGPGTSADKEITILRHDKNPAAGSRPVPVVTSTGPIQQTVPSGSQVQSIDRQQLPVSKTSASDADSNAFTSAHVIRPVPATGWTSDSDLNTGPAVQNNHWQSIPTAADHPDARSPLYDRTARTANLTTLGKKKTAVPSGTSSDVVPDPASVTSRSDDSSWRRKPDEQSNDRMEETKRPAAAVPDVDHFHQNLRNDSRPSHESHQSLPGVRGGSGDGSGNSDSAPNFSFSKRSNELPHQDKNRQHVPTQSDQSKPNRNQHYDDRRREIRPDSSRNDQRGQHRQRDDHYRDVQRDQRRDGARRRSQEDSMTFDYRDLPKSALTGIVPEGKETATPANKDHAAGQQFPSQKNEIHRKGQQSSSNRGSGPVLARVAGNSNYGPPPSKAAFESKSVASDSRAPAASSSNTVTVSTQQSRQHDSHARREPHDSKLVPNRNETSDWKKDRPSVPRDEKQTGHNQQHRNQHVRDDQRSNQRHSSQQNYDHRLQRDNRRNDQTGRSDRSDYRSENQRIDPRRENRPNDRPHRSDQRRVTPPESDIPPRFRHKVRSGTESSKGSRSGQGDKSRSSVSHAESDVGNEEWETASESSHKDLTVPAPAAVHPNVVSGAAAVPHKAQTDKIDHRNVRETSNRKSDPNTRTDQRRHDRSDGGRDDRRDTNHKKGGRSDDRVRDDRRNSNRNDQRNDGRNYRSQGDDGRRRRDEQRDYRSSETTRNKKWADGPKGSHDEVIVQRMSQVKLDDPDSAVSSLKKNMQSMSLGDHRDERRGEDPADDFSVVDRHNKRAKGSNEETESKKMKPEVSISSKSRHSKTSSPRVSSKLSGSRDLRLQKLSDDAFKMDPDRLSSLGGQDADSPSKEANAWSKPLSHAPPTRSTSSSAVTFASSKSDTRPAPANAAQLAISSKTSSFEHQDSGVDVGSDHPQSAASSQRSSPNNGTEKKTGQLPAKSPLAAAAPIAEESPEPPLHGTLIYENSRYRQQQVDALSGIPDNVHGKSAAAPRAVRSSGNVSHTAAPIPNDYSNRSKVHPIRPPVHQPQNRQKDMPSVGQSMTSDLDQKIASVKKVWNDPASPGIATDVCGDHYPTSSKSPAIRNQYPPGVNPIGMGYGMSIPTDSMSVQMNSMKQMQSGRQSQQQQPQQPHSQYQRSLSGHYISSHSPPVNLMNQLSSPPPQLDVMRQHMSQQQHHQQQQQQQQQHFVQQQGTGGSGHGPSIPTPPVTHPMYNMATIANMYSPAFNQHMDPRASVQLQAFAQQLAFHQNQQNQQHPMRSAVQAAPHPAAAAAAHGAYGPAAAQMSDYRNMSQVAAAVGQHQPQHQSQQQQSNLMKAQHQYMQQPNFQFWNR